MVLEISQIIQKAVMVLDWMNKGCEVCAANEMCAACSRWFFESCDGCLKREQCEERILCVGLPNEDQNRFGHAYAEDMCGWMLETEIENGRQEYYDAWWEYISEYADE